MSLIMNMYDRLTPEKRKLAQKYDVNLRKLRDDVRPINEIEQELVLEERLDQEYYHPGSSHLIKNYGI